VISLKAEDGSEYNRGLRNPSGDSFWLSRISFNKVTIPAKIGVEAEVPAAH